MTTHIQDISNFSTDGSSCVFVSGKKVNRILSFFVVKYWRDNELQYDVLQIIWIFQEGTRGQKYQCVDAENIGGTSR